MKPHLENLPRSAKRKHRQTDHQIRHREANDEHIRHVSQLARMIDSEYHEHVAQHHHHVHYREHDQGNQDPRSGPLDALVKGSTCGRVQLSHFSWQAVAPNLEPSQTTSGRTTHRTTTLVKRFHRKKTDGYRSPGSPPSRRGYRSIDQRFDHRSFRNPGIIVDRSDSLSPLYICIFLLCIFVRSVGRILLSGILFRFLLRLG